jgi:ligand-binding sensor domain-containing protein
MTSRWIGAVCVTIVLWGIAIRPVVALDPNRPLTRFTLENWTSQDGLPIDVAEALAVTPDRYLWIGTQAGLVR